MKKKIRSCHLVSMLGEYMDHPISYINRKRLIYLRPKKNSKALDRLIGRGDC